MQTEDAFDRWFVFVSADAVATRALTTEEILDAHGRGTLSERAVLQHRFGARRDSITVKDLIDRTRASASAKKKK